MLTHTPGFTRHLLAMLLCSGFSLSMAADRLTVYSVNYPLQYFAQRIAGEHADVVLPVPGDVDPAFWEPPVETIVDYQQADLVLLNGAGYARWTGRVSLPPSRLVDTSAAFADDYIAAAAAAVHSHGPGGDHSHTGTAFTTWLDFSLAIAQAAAIRQALTGLRPQLAGDFERNYIELEKDLQGLDRSLRAVVAENINVSLLASHPVYQYLGRRYALKLRSLVWEPGLLPAEAEWAALEQLLGTHPAGFMLWEAEPLQDTVTHLEALGIQSIVFDPAGNRPEQGDFMTVMQRNIGNLAMVYECCWPNEFGPTK